MRIALLTDGISPYVIGGMQRHSFYLAKYFAKNKVYVDLFQFNQSSLNIEILECFEEEEKKYINSFVIPFPKPGRLPGHYIYESYIYSKKIFDIIKTTLNQYDFIYAKGFSGWKLIQEKNKGLQCPPIGTNFHGYEMFQEPANKISSKSKKIIINYFTQKILDNSDYVFSYGGMITDILIEVANVSKKKIIEIPSAIENKWLLNEVKQKNPIPNFLFIGRFDERKGLKELNSVLSNLLKNKELEFKFQFIGPIINEAKIFHAKIEYLGEIRDDSNIKKNLEKSDVIVCPSYSEGMPNVIMEAMANKMAVIASDVGAVNLLVNEQNGLLISPKNTIELKSAILLYLKLDKVKLSEQQNNSYEIIKTKFLWDEIILTTISKIKKISDKV
jgi:glycosyltransferase involved in cell wall biosynthesis